MSRNPIASGPQSLFVNVSLPELDRTTHPQNTLTISRPSNFSGFQSSSYLRFHLLARRSLCPSRLISAPNPLQQPASSPGPFIPSFTYSLFTVAHRNHDRKFSPKLAAQLRAPGLLKLPTLVPLNCERALCVCLVLSPHFAYPKDCQLDRAFPAVSSWGGFEF